MTINEVTKNARFEQAEKNLGEINRKLARFILPKKAVRKRKKEKWIDPDSLKEPEFTKREFLSAFDSASRPILESDQLEREKS